MSRWKAILVDLDGTLCDTKHRVHHLQSKPRDWDSFYAGIADDELVPAVDKVIRMAMYSGSQIVYLTGRPDNHRAATEQWLKDHGLYTIHLYMRRAGDFRVDDIVKRETYEADISPLFEIQFVLEDRSRVVQMWRSLGLACFQVADGDF